MKRRFVNNAPQIRLSCRAAICLSLPLLVGLITNQRPYSIVFGIGALWAISQDGLDEWHVRGPRLLSVAIAAGSGATIGATAVGFVKAEWFLMVLFGVVALIAGFVEASNWATSGAYLLIGSILGAGLQFTGKVWQSCLCLTLGALWVYGVAAITDSRRRLANQRIFLAEAYDALATLVETVSTANFFAVRAKVVRRLDAAQDVIGGSHFTLANAEEVALRQGLIVALRTGEVISYLEGKHLTIETSVPRALREMATVFRESSPQEATRVLRELQNHFNAIGGVSASVTTSLALSDPSQLEGARLRSSSRSSTRLRLPVIERLRFSSILCIAVVTGTLISQELDGPHGFWLPLSIAFIFRPDLGPVIKRALARTAGTVIGVGIAGLVSLTGNSISLLIVLSCVMAALVPWAVKKSHFLAVITFTPIVFVFLSLLGADKYLFGPRIIDTGLGAAIVLVLDLLLWSTAPTLRPSQQLERAKQAVDRYKKDATTNDVRRRHLLRRGALRAVADARQSLALASSEPHPLRRPEATTLDELDTIEASIDEHTVALFEQ